MFQVIIRGLSLLPAMWITVFFKGIQIPTTQQIRRIFDARTVSHPILLVKSCQAAIEWRYWKHYTKPTKDLSLALFSAARDLLKFKSTKNRPKVGEDVLHRLHRWCLGKNTKVSWGRHTGNLPRFFFGGVLPVPDNAFNRITPSSGIWTGMSNPYPCFESPFIKNFTLWYLKPTMAQIYLRSVEPWLVFFEKRMNNMNNENFPVSMVITHSNPSATSNSYLDLWNTPPKKTKLQQQSWAVFFFFVVVVVAWKVPFLHGLNFHPSSLNSKSSPSRMPSASSARNGPANPSPKEWWEIQDLYWPSWWFQPLWKILVKLDHFPR